MTEHGQRKSNKKCHKAKAEGSQFPFEKEMAGVMSRRKSQPCNLLVCSEYQLQDK